MGCCQSAGSKEVAQEAADSFTSIEGAEPADGHRKSGAGKRVAGAPGRALKRALSKQSKASSDEGTEGVGPARSSSAVCSARDREEMISPSVRALVSKAMENAVQRHVEAVAAGKLTTAARSLTARLDAVAPKHATAEAAESAAESASVSGGGADAIVGNVPVDTHQRRASKDERQDFYRSVLAKADGGAYVGEAVREYIGVGAPRPPPTPASLLAHARSSAGAHSLLLTAQRVLLVRSGTWEVAWTVPWGRVKGVDLLTAPYHVVQIHQFEQLGSMATPTKGAGIFDSVSSPIASPLAAFGLASPTGGASPRGAGRIECHHAEAAREVYDAVQATRAEFAQSITERMLNTPTK